MIGWTSRSTSCPSPPTGPPPCGPSSDELQQPEIHGQHDHDDQEAPAGQVAAEHEEEPGHDHPDDAQAVEVLQDPPAGAANPSEPAAARPVPALEPGPGRPPSVRPWRRVERIHTA